MVRQLPAATAHFYLCLYLASTPRCPAKPKFGFTAAHLDAFPVLDWRQPGSFRRAECVHFPIIADREFPLAVDSADNAFALRLDHDPGCDPDRDGTRKRPCTRPPRDPVPDPAFANSAPANVALLRAGQLGKSHLMDWARLHHIDLCVRLISGNG